MAFPISPTIGQEYTIGTHTYEWNGTAWDIAGSTTASAIADKADQVTTYTKTEVDNLLDTKADTTYVDSEIDAIPSSLSKVASNVLLSGNLAFADYAVTKNFATVTYTGNGSTQNITTGISSVDFTVSGNGSGYWLDRSTNQVKNDVGVVQASGSCVCNVSKVHIKSRSNTLNNFVYDGLRGVTKSIYTDLTNSEEVYTDALVSFLGNGFTVSGNVYVNYNTYTYVAYQTLYTHIKWGTTNQGKRYITAYNPVTREVMTMYQGSGVAGHQIPNPLGIKLDYIDVKNLSAIQNWTSNAINIQKRGNLNLTGAFIDGVIINSIDNYIEIMDISNYSNASNNSYISYGFANSETKIITQYQGTGASGNFVETKDVYGVARKPRRVIGKAMSATGNWYVHDTERGETKRFFLDDSEVENDDGYYVHITSNGFEPSGDAVSHSNWNTSGVTYIALVEFDTNGDGGDSYFNLPTDDSVLNVTAGKLPYTDGRDTTNGAYNVFTQSYTGSVDFSTCPDGIHYVALDSNNTPKFYDALPIFNTVNGVMYDNDGTTALTTPISFIDDKPYQVASGTPIDRLVDYPSIPKNVMESSYVDGDLEVSGEVKGKNQCTGWVNFDGTTTPPTIRDSFNVSDVVRTATGVYDVYFEEDMDTRTYSIGHSLGNFDDYTVGGRKANFFNFQTNMFTLLNQNAVNSNENINNITLTVFGGKNS